MGSFDETEVCELVGLYLLDQPAEILGKENVGLLRDDGLTVIKSGSGPAIERTRKKITKLLTYVYRFFFGLKKCFFLDFGKKSIPKCGSLKFD